MAALIPVTQPTNVEAAYEDMFKEITRKLYGEETGNGLHTLGTPVAHVATSGPTAPEGERSFTTLMSDRSLAPTIEYDHNGGSETTNHNFKTEDHLTTAFGLAALMQNGFPPTSTILNTQGLPKTSANAITTVAATTSGNVGVNNNNSSNVAASNPNLNEPRWSGTSEDIISWSTAGKLASFSSSQKTAKLSKNRDQSNDLYTDSVSNNTGGNSGSNRKNKNQNLNHNSSGNQVQVQKRYSCSHCPYSTDRRDLFTRHENIHKDEKPFQCYACLKQFNRADHVKKHFLRMHRELAYDINKTRRSISVDQKPNIFPHNTNNNQQQISDNFLNAQRNNPGAQDTSLSIAQTIESVATAQLPQHPIQLKQEKTSDNDKSPVKVKREKRFSCCYCPWSGADKWGLKRHLNTHTKPFICMLCDYKAARSERLATHVLKVHNKKACNKCSFLADNQEEYQAHINEIHPHDQRPSRSNNSSNVLRTIGNTLVTNNQLNNFQNPSTSFGAIQASNSGVALYTTNDIANSTNSSNPNGLQEIVVNPSSMVGWRLSASGSLIPPNVHGSGNNESSLTGSGPSNQKRGAERLFQYLEADGSDPEDYTRQLKMDAISRNTASVAQDFHNAGGVGQDLYHIPKYYQAATNPNQKENFMTSVQATLINKNHENMSDLKLHTKKAMLNSNEDQINEQKYQLKKSPPAYFNSIKREKDSFKEHRRLIIDQQNKENSNSIFTRMEYTNVQSLGIQFQNYVKNVINKYYAETPLLYTALSQQQQNSPEEKLSAGDYLDYLKNKNDITLIIGPKFKKESILENNQPIISEKRNRKQAQPKKITKRDVMSILRDKYMKRLVDKKKSCVMCTNANRKHMLVFSYHSAGSLVLHNIWRHSPKNKTCQICQQKFMRDYSLKVHRIIKHKSQNINTR